MKKETLSFSVPMGTKIKHHLAVSALAGPISGARRLLGRLSGLRHPELGLLRQENAMIDALLARLIKADWHCLDVGGHLGSVSHQMRTLAPRGTLTIVEASPGKASLLTKSFPKATVHAVAVSDTEGDVSFFENLDQPGYSSLANRDMRGATREITVPSRRLDDLLGATPVNFLKIDVEGFEYAALRGGAKMLARDTPLILFEAGALTDSQINTAAADRLFDWLTHEMGYDIYAAFDLYYERPPLAADQFTAYRRYPFLAFNYFALPRGIDPASCFRRN